MERQIHLVAWETITNEKEKGELRLQNMRQLNSAFLMKLGWRLAMDPKALWTRVLRAKYYKGKGI